MPMSLAIVLTNPSPSGHNTLMAFIRRLHPLWGKEHLFKYLGIELFECLAQSKSEGARALAMIEDMPQWVGEPILVSKGQVKQ